MLSGLDKNSVSHRHTCELCQATLQCLGEFFLCFVQCHLGTPMFRDNFSSYGILRTCRCAHSLCKELVATHLLLQSIALYVNRQDEGNSFLLLLQDSACAWRDGEQVLAKTMLARKLCFLVSLHIYMFFRMQLNDTVKVSTSLKNLDW